ASACEAIITILTDAAAIDAVYGGPEGLLAGDVQGKLFIEMSTVQPATELPLADKGRRNGAAFVGWPVGGTPGPAPQGPVNRLLGAGPADAGRAEPLLRQMCRRLEHCGPVGAGSTMKLAINLPLMVSWQAFGEAFALTRDLGVDPERLLSLFTDISAATNAIKARAAMIAAELKGAGGGSVTFTIDSGAKDLRTMAAEGGARGLELPLTERTAHCFEEASRSGWGARDSSAVTAYWSKRGKL